MDEKDEREEIFFTYSFGLRKGKLHGDMFEPMSPSCEFALILIQVAKIIGGKSIEVSLSLKSLREESY